MMTLRGAYDFIAIIEGSDFETMAGMKMLMQSTGTIEDMNIMIFMSSIVPVDCINIFIPAIVSKSDPSIIAMKSYAPLRVIISISFPPAASVIFFAASCLLSEGFLTKPARPRSCWFR